MLTHVEIKLQSRIRTPTSQRSILVWRRNVKLHALGVLLLLLVFAAFPSAQTNPLVGTWERTSLTDAQGKSTQPPTPAAYLIMTADGFYSQTAIPTGRPKTN